MAGKKTTNDKTSKIKCSFCGKTQKQVGQLIAGPDGIYICDECIRTCNEIMNFDYKSEFEDERYQ